MDEELFFEEEDFETQVNVSTLRRTAKLGFRHWQMMGGFALGILFVSMLEAYFNVLVARVIDEGLMAGDMQRLTETSIQYGLVWIPFALCVFLFIISAGYLGHRVQYDLRKEMFAHLQKLQLAYYDKTPTGWLQARVTSDVTRVGDLVSWGFLDLMWGTAAISTSLAFMFWMNWQLASVVALIVPLILVAAWYFKRRILQQYRTVRKANSNITRAYSESISGARVVKALGREDINLDRFEDLTTTMFESSFRAMWLSALFLPVVQFIAALGVGAIIWVGGWQVELGQLSVGEIQAFVGYVTFMLWPIQQLAAVYATMQQAIASAERVFSLLDTEPTIVDSANAVDPVSLRGDIVFDHVHFAYDNENDVLHDFSLHVRPGETLALVGPTGAGKSTIVNLVARFYEPTHGRICIAGRDYKEWTLQGIQSKLGMVLQTPYLFSGSILDNIRYGRLDATDDEVIAAAQTAGADSFINDLEHQYTTQVGEDGVLLSVGQKQLISLARAILADPDILIMDEATSSVDTLTEALIQQGMETLMQGRTSFVIAHRLSTIKNADRILVLKDGQIDEIGTHRELLRERGHYYDLYTKQFRKEREVELVKVYGADAVLA